MRTTRFIQFFAIAAMGLVVLQRVSAQSIVVIPTVTQADIINATALVDPLSEQVKNIAPTSFSLRIINNRTAVVWVDLHIQAFVTLDQDGPPAKLIATAYTKRPFPVPTTGRIFTSLDAQEGYSKDIDIVANVDEAMKTRLKNMISDPASGGKVPSAPCRPTSRSRPRGR